ncbi:Dimeric alpha-beta barrel [Phytophthora cactorum]|nr:Dimeric alpha-beta barrel [Phytophthora cactorum]
MGGLPPQRYRSSYVVPSSRSLPTIGLGSRCQLISDDGVEDQLRAKLAEAAQTYSKDVGVLGWYPMQNVSDSRKWTIVERYDQESCRWPYRVLAVLLATCTVAKHREYPATKRAYKSAVLTLVVRSNASTCALNAHERLELLTAIECPSTASSTLKSLKEPNSFQLHNNPSFDTCSGLYSLYINKA